MKNTCDYSVGGQGQKALLSQGFLKLKPVPEKRNTLGSLGCLGWEEPRVGVGSLAEEGLPGGVWLGVGLDIGEENREGTQPGHRGIAGGVLGGKVGRDGYGAEEG